MFYCIGAQKAGTTWLHRLLQTHPQCHVTRAKEVHYFDVLDGQMSVEQRKKLRIRDIDVALNQLSSAMMPADRNPLLRASDAIRHLAMYTAIQEVDEGLNAYISYLLHEWQSEQVVCDITPSYSLLNTERFKEMANLGAARFAFIMRDPVSRVWSQVRMSVRLEFEREGRDPNGEEYADACHQRVRHYARGGIKRLRRSTYIETIKRLEAAIDRERILYLFFENLFVPETLQKISTFLNIDNRFVVPSSKINEGISVSLNRENAQLLRTTLKEQCDGLSARFGRDLPDAWSKWD